jgi:hypothetical protein
MSLILLFAALGVVGCASVRVIDEAGQPIRAAKVSAVTASINGTSRLTNASGEAIVPRFISIQQAQWILVSKEGFKARQIDVSDHRPLTVVLQASQ